MADAFLIKTIVADIRVNAIAPGFLLTEQNRYLLPAGRRVADIARRKGACQNTDGALRRAGGNGGSSHLAMFGCASSFVNGAVIPDRRRFFRLLGVSKYRKQQR